MKKVTVLLCMFFISISLIEAQNFAKKGCFEVGGSIGFTSNTPVIGGDTKDATTTFSFSSFTGYFITDGFEIGFAPLNYSVTSPPEGDNTTQLTVLLAPAYNFDMKTNIYPFIEGLVGYTSISSGDVTLDGISYGVRGGIKIVLGKNALVNAGVQYMNYTYKPEDADERTGTNQLMINAGLAVYFDLGK